MPELKVTDTHLRRDAYLYIRQSSLRQVVEHAESTKRQYALRDRAVALGWPRERIYVIDTDLGKSGAHATDRAGFQQLVSDVALGKAGIVMGLEVSRLARNSSDWHRLLELCALTSTLILDEDGIYDPTCFNDRLLLGLKGTMGEAELHVLKARLRGGVVNKAQRGELMMGPPIGFVYRDDGRLVLDPDGQVQAAIRLVFETFQRTGSAMQTARYFRDQGLRFPRRVRSGERKGELLWAPPQHSRILQILHNPRYAGAFVYGRTRTRYQAKGKYSAMKVSQTDWPFLIHDRHPGYITWAQFEATQQRLADNALGFGTQRRGGPVRGGPALLQGRVWCGVCGERMGVHYTQEHNTPVPIYVCQEDAVRRGARVCQRIPGQGIDATISTLLLELMTPLTIEVALAVQQEVEARWAESDALRQQQVERARYEAELARRRYMTVDPAHRLVADVLEAEWNEKLRAYQTAQDDYTHQRQHDRQLMAGDERQKLLALATDFPRIWKDPTVAPRERKRLVRLLIEDVTLVQTEVITVHVRLRGGATRTLTVARPVPIAQLRKTRPEIVTKIDELLETYCDREVALLLNQHGCYTWQGQPFTLKKIAWIRAAYQLTSRYHRLRAKGYLSATEMSRHLGVSATTVHEWARHGLLRTLPYDCKNRCLYEPMPQLSVRKGCGGRGARQPSFTVRASV